MFGRQSPLNQQVDADTAHDWRLLKIRGTCCLLFCICLPSSPVVLLAKKLKFIVIHSDFVNQLF